jgi:beta-glucosidase
MAGLFEDPYTNPKDYPAVFSEKNKSVALEMAEQSIVLLKNKDDILPLIKENTKVAVIGPLADAAHEQLGTWVFDGHKEDAITPLSAIKSYAGKQNVYFAKGMEISRTMDHSGFPSAMAAARKSDVILLFIGEESILSGESHCRADINLPGVQEELIKELSKSGKPIIGIIMAGRPLTIETSLPHLDAVLYAWHPGTMAGPAISNILYGEESPSGKLPVTFPRVVGQVPVYYNQKNSGKPASDDTWERMYDIPVEAPQLSIGNTNHYLDYGFEPLFPFGYGLSYTQFEYANINVSSDKIQLGERLIISATLTNTGKCEGTEVAQLYVRDLVGSRTRPVRELKGFQRITLAAGESKQVKFTLHTDDLAFYNDKMKRVTEPGTFHAWIGGNSKADLRTEFKIIE